MMNPFIQSLMQQTEQASKQALAEQQQGGSDMLAMAMMGLGGFGGEGGLSIGGNKPQSGGVPGIGATPAAYTPPTAPIEPTYRAPYSAPAPAPAPALADPQSRPFAPTTSAPAPSLAEAITPTPSDIADKWARNDPGATPPALLTVDEKWTKNDPGATPQTPAQAAASAVLNPVEPTAPTPAAPTPTGGGAGDEPINMAKYLEWSGRDLGMTPQEYQQEGVAVPDWGYVAPTETPAFGPISWNTDRATLDGILPEIVQAYEEAAYAANAAVTNGRYVPEIEVWSGADGHSRNHNGYAADIAFIDNEGNALAWNDPWVQNFTVEGARRGLAQLGAGPTYMLRYDENRQPIGGDRIHFGGVTPGYDTPGRVRTWSDSDAEWGSDYSGGVSGDQAWLARLQEAAANPVALGMDMPPIGGEQGWQLVGGDPSLYPGTLPEWLDAPTAQPTEIASTKNDPTAPVASDMTFAGNPNWGERQNQFVNDMLPYALKVSEMTGLDPRLVIAQSALETGFGQSAPGNNYFGIKSHGKPGGNTFATTEYFDGQKVGINDSFRAYDGMEQSAMDYVQFLRENGRYRDYLAAPDYESQLAALGASGYATDPNYTSKIDSLVRGINLSPVVPSTQAPEAQTSGPASLADGLTWAGGDNWTSPYNNRNMAIFGGVRGEGRYWHDWGDSNTRAHDNSYSDYSQMYREFTYEPKPGYVPVGERDGRTVYAAPAPEYLEGNQPVSRDSYTAEARSRGALIPTEAEMRALYGQAQHVPMPTFPNGVGDPAGFLSRLDAPESGVWVGPKEFYRTNDSVALPYTFAEAMQDPRVAEALMQDILLRGAR